MDALSELLADVRIRDAVFVRTRLGAQGVLRVGEARQPCFHLVTQGRVWLRPAAAAAPIQLNTGDVAFFPQGEAHWLGGQPPAGPQGAVDLLQCWRQASPGHGDVVDALATEAGQPCVARTLSGCMHIEGVAPAWLWGGLPPWLTLQWGPQQSMPAWLSMGLAYLEQELGRQGMARQAVIDRLGDILFIQSLRTYLHGPVQAPAGWLMGLKDDMVSRVLGAMHREPARPWQVAELAQVGCVSRSVLAERFAQLLGEPPLTYLTRHRMSLAARRLLCSADAVADVARAVGYQSGAAFAQAFKREFACSPREYRARHQAGSPADAGGGSAQA